jgi:hypothetical protein
MKEEIFEMNSLNTGLLCYDERDFYLTPFGAPESVSVLVHSTLDLDNSPKYQYKSIKYSYLFGCVQPHLINPLKHVLVEEMKKPILVGFSLSHILFFTEYTTKRIVCDIVFVQVLCVDWMMLMFRHAVNMSCGNGENQVGGMNTQPKFIQNFKVHHSLN